MENHENSNHVAKEFDPENGPASALIEQQKKFDEYYVLTQDELGCGGQAKVMRGIEIESMSYVAVKVANSAHLEEQMNIV